jgi:DNA mismatch repair ATPase MutS
MKALLMHGDRDFDPSLLLMRRERELRHSRNAEPGLDLRTILPWNAEALRQDLGLDVLLNAMSAGDRFLFEVAQVSLLCSLNELPAVRYRQHVLADSLRNAPVVRAMYGIAVEAIEGEKRNYWSSFGRYPAGTLHRAVDILQSFVAALKKLKNIAVRHSHRFESSGYSRLLTMLKAELSDDYFDEIDEHLQRLRFRHGTLISARLGRGVKGSNHVLRKPKSDTRNLLARLLTDRAPSYSFRLHPRDEAGAQALSALNDRGVNLVANALAQSTDHILSFFQMLRTELAFYIGCLNLHRRLAELNEPVCFPTPSAAGTRRLSCAGLRDAALALSMNSAVVGNDVEADGSDAVIITGANTGGKSTFLRSVGLAQLMMQAGMFVPAQQYSAELCEGLITHYKREEDAGMESGKLDEELGRMSEIVGKIGPHSVLLLNESFASTNEREGSEIAGQIVGALMDAGVRVFYVTHLYHFARSLLAQDRDRAVFLRAERKPDGTRPFKLVAGEPLQTSYGEDLYRAVFSEDGPSCGAEIDNRQNEPKSVSLANR